MHTKNSVLSKALHLNMSQSGAILRVVNICVGSCGGAAGGEIQGQLWTQVATKEAAAGASEETWQLRGPLWRQLPW